MKKSRQYVTTETTNSLLIKVFRSEAFLESAKFLLQSAKKEKLADKVKILSEAIKETRQTRDRNVILLKGRKLDHIMKQQLKEVISKSPFKPSSSAIKIYNDLIRN